MRRRPWRVLLFGLAIALLAIQSWLAALTMSHQGPHDDARSDALTFRPPPPSPSHCQPVAHQPAVFLSFPSSYNTSQLYHPPQQHVQGQARCQFLRDPELYSYHFPHTLQQLLICFSYWQAHPHQTPYLITGGGWKPSSTFNEGLWQMLQTQWGVQIRNFAKPGTAAVPIVHRWEGYKMASADDGLQKWRASVSESSSCGRRQPRIGLLQRQSTRMWTNVDAVHRALGGWNTTMTTFVNASFADQVSFFAHHDVVVGPHGAEWSSLWALPHCGSVLELFPENYWTPSFFGSLAGLRKVASYGAVYVGEGMPTLAATQEARQEARSVSLCVRVDVVVDAVAEMVERWRQCCATAAGGGMDERVKEGD